MQGMKELDSENKKKSITLKQSLDRCIQTLKELDAAETYPNVLKALNDTMTVLLSPIKITLDLKLQKSYLVCIGIIQSMIQINILTDEKLTYVLDIMQNMLVNNTTEMLNIRVLQISLSVLNPKTLKCISPDFVQLILKIAFITFGIKSQGVQCSSMAVLSQLFILIFEKYPKKAEIKENQDEEKKLAEENLEEMDDITRSGCKILFTDLMNIIKTGNSPKYPNSPLNTRIQGIELLSCIMYKSSDIIKAQPELKKILVGLEEILEEEFSRIAKYEIENIILLVKGVIQYVLIMEKGYQLILSLIAMLKNVDIRYVILGLEGLLVLFNNHSFLRKLYLNKSPISHDKSMLDEVLLSLNEIISSTFSENVSLDKYSPRNRTSFLRGWDLIQVTESPKVPSLPQLFKLIVEIITSIGDSIGLQALESGIQAGILTPLPLTENQEYLLVVVENSWFLLHEMINCLLVISEGDLEVQGLLSALQGLLGTVGALRIESAKTTLLNTLCGNSTPVKAGLFFEYTVDDSLFRILKTKNILATNVLFNVAHCLAPCMHEKNWIRILHTLQVIENLIHRFNYEKYGTQPPALKFQLINQRVATNLKKYSGTYKVNMGDSDPLSIQSPKENEEVKEEFQPTIGGISHSHPTFTTNKNIHNEEQRDTLPLMIITEKSSDSPSRSGIKESIVRKASSGLQFISAQLASSVNEMQKLLDLSKLGKKEEKQIRLQEHIAEQDEIAAMHTELPILQSALDSLFASSIDFPDVNLKELIHGLGHLTLQMMEGMSGLESAARKDLDQLNMFGVIRLLEASLVNIHRINIFWDFLVAHLDCLANSRWNELRAIAVDSLLCIIQNVFLSRNSLQIGDSSPSQMQSLKARGLEWQAAILEPLAQILNNHFVDTHLVMFQSFHRILENYGMEMGKEGWEVILRILHESGSIGSSELAAQAFTSIELIISHYISSLHESNLPAIIHLLGNFANLKSDINISFASVGMLQNVADQLRKFKETHDLAFSPQKITKEFLDDKTLENLWISIFDMLNEIGKDSRYEVRVSSFRTLENIAIDHSQYISLEIWNKVLMGIIHPLLVREVNLYILQQENNIGETLPDSGANPNIIQTPKFLGGLPKGKDQRVMTFDDETIKKKSDVVVENIQQLEETILLLINSFVRMIRKLYGLYWGKETIKGDMLSRGWVELMSVMSKVAKNGSYSLISGLFKCVEQLIESCVELYQGYFNSIWNVFDSLCSWLGSKQGAIYSINKPMSSKLTPTLVNTFKLLFTRENARKIPQLLQPTIIFNFFLLLRKIIGSSKTSEGVITGMTRPDKLLSEENNIFGVIEYLPEVFLNEKEYLPYFEFLLNFLVFDNRDAHSEAYIRRSLIIFKHHIINQQFPLSHYQALLPKLYTNEACKVLLFNAKENDGLWHFVGIMAIQISTFFLSPSTYFQIYEEDLKNETEESKKIPNKEENPIITTQQLKETLPIKRKNETGSRMKNFADLVIDESSSVGNRRELSITTKKDVDDAFNINNMSSELKELLWKHIIKLVEGVLGEINDKYLTIRGIIQEVQKKSENLEIEMMNFIIKILLPLTSDERVECQSQLIAIIDRGCSIKNSASNMASGQKGAALIAPSNLSHFCINNLFDMCEWEDNPQPIKGKIAAVTTSVLINRCKATLLKFLADEKRSGMMPLPQSRVKETMHLLNKLKDLDIFPSILNEQGKTIPEQNSSLLNGKKAHLFTLMPELSELIGSKEIEVKEALKLIFLGMAKEIGCFSNK